MIAMPLLLALATPAVAADETERATLVLVRALASDRALPERADDPIDIGVLHGAGRDSQRSASAALRSLAALEGVKVAGLPIGAPRDVEAAGLALETQRMEGLDVLLAVRGVSEADLAAARAFCGERDVLLVSLDPDHVGHGATLAVQAEEGRLQLVWHRRTADDQGVRLSGELLAMAREVP